MKFRRLNWVILGIPFFIQCNYYDGIPVIGIDPHGNPVQVFIPKSEYPKRLYATVSSIQDSALPMLSKNQGNSSTSWRLRTIAFGMGVSTKIGIGPFQVGAVPRFRIMFTNSSDPALP